MDNPIYSNASYSKKISKNFLFLIPVVLLILIAVYFFYKYQTTKSQLDTQDLGKKSAEDAKKLVDEVGKLVVLPSGEVPTVAVVTDIAKLQGQPFFANAKNGDKVLIYPNAQKAILYDPAINKVVEIGPINLNSKQSNPSVLQTKVIIRNGTTKPGLTTDIEQVIKKTFPSIIVVSKDQAKRTDYDKTIVIPLNDTAKDAAAQISNLLHATVSTIPLGEQKVTGADVMVIVGKE